MKQAAAASLVAWLPVYCEAWISGRQKRVAKKMPAHRAASSCYRPVLLGGEPSTH